MSYYNRAEQSKKKRQFAGWFTLTLVLVLAMLWAFKVPPPVYQTQVVARQLVIDSLVKPAVRTLPADTTSVVDTLAPNQILALQTQLNEKEEIIAKLRRQLANARNGSKVPGASKLAEENRFLKWALSSQSGELDKLRADAQSRKSQ